MASRNTSQAASLLLLLLAAQTTRAQSAPQPAERSDVDLIATEQDLWMLQTWPQRSVVYHRGVNEPFRPAEPLGARIVSLTATGGTLYTFAEGGEFWSLTGNDWTRELDLPSRALPIELVGGQAGVYALVHAPTASSLPQLVDGARSSTSQPFDPGTSGLAVVRYDSQGWAALAPCPPTFTTDGPLPAHIGLLREVVQLFWSTSDGRHIASVRYDAQDGPWHPAGITPEIAGVRQFWLTTVSRVPTLVVAVVGTAGGEELRAFRALGSDEATIDWRPAALQLSALPAGVQTDQYHAAVGFNQHVALLMSGQSDAPCLRFGRVDAPAAEPSVPVADILGLRDRLIQPQQWLQGATLAVLGTILLALFLFRRGALVATVALPADCALALTVQRLLAWAIDLTPFALGVAALLHVDWWAALQQLSSWAAGSEMSAGRLPGAAALSWWALSCGVHSVYGIVMETLTQRTLGKMLLGTRVVSEGGQPARLGQIVVRNLLRFLELLPPLWLLGFLVVLSRNRQRLGDIFARTIVVRRARPAPRDREN